MIISGLKIYNIVIVGDVAHVEFARPAELMMDGESQMPLLVKTISVTLLPVDDSIEIELEPPYDPLRPPAL